MKPETLPPPTLSAEAHWVQAELVRSLMRTQRDTQWVGVLLVAVIAGVLWNDVSHTWLGLWVVLGAAVVGWRYWILRCYEREVVHRGSDEHLAFHRRHQLIWPASALTWGLTTLLYFDRSSLADQFICWLIIAGLAMFASSSLSTQLATMRAYLDTLAVTALAVMAWRMGV